MNLSENSGGVRILRVCIGAAHTLKMQFSSNFWIGAKTYCSLKRFNDYNI